MFKRMETGATAASAELEQMLDQVDMSTQIPSCIPREGWSLFLRATPETQREMVRTARQPSLIEIKPRARLESEFNQRAAPGKLCYCRELERCPLAPRVDIRTYYNCIDSSKISQYFPKDRGWFGMRSIANSLDKYAKEHELLPNVTVYDPAHRAQHLDPEQIAAQTPANTKAASPRTLSPFKTA